VGRKAKSTSITVIEGLLLNKTDASPFWQCYCRIKPHSFRKSTGTEDLEKAKRQALEWFFEVKGQAARGVALKRITFNTLCANYLKTVIGTAKQQYHSETINRHFKPFFKDVDLKQITDGTIADYIVHRRNKNEKEPTPQTLNRENTVLRQMLSYAFAQRWLNQQIKVPHLSEAQSKRRRSHFTAQEYRKLCGYAKTRIYDAIEDSRIHHAENNRKLLYDVIRLLANSGLRVDEMSDLTWRNIDWEKGDIVLNRAGKLKSSRRVVLKRGAIDALENIKYRRKLWLEDNEGGGTVKMTDKVVALPDGTIVGSMKTAFGALLDACNFSYVDASERHTLTSLRHTYATLSLTKRSGRRVTVEALAKQMGTSAKMIQAHYGHDTVEDYREELREGD
jgi:integrase